MKKNRIKIIPILGLFFFLTAATTYPLLFKIRSHISGFSSTDEPFAALWNFWWFKYAFTHHIRDTFYSIIAAPFGFDTGSHCAYPVWEFLYKWLAIFTNNIFAFNMQV